MKLMLQDKWMLGAMFPFYALTLHVVYEMSQKLSPWALYCLKISKLLLMNYWIGMKNLSIVYENWCVNIQYGFRFPSWLYSLLVAGIPFPPHPSVIIYCSACGCLVHSAHVLCSVDIWTVSHMWCMNMSRLCQRESREKTDHTISLPPGFFPLNSRWYIFITFKANTRL